MAQLDRATVCGTVGRRFESSWARSFFILNTKNNLTVTNEKRVVGIITPKDMLS